MQDRGAQVRWGVQRRIEFIDFRLFWDGRFNRTDIIQTFSISAAQASADIAQYERVAPSNFTYDRRLKRYERTPDFVPAFIGETIERYMLQLVAIENRWMRQEDTWFDVLPPIEIVTLGRRPTNPEVLLRVLDAIRFRRELDIEYSSLSGSEQLPRTIAPHALSHSAGRWYLRSWTREHNDFRDYSLSRISAVKDVRPATVDYALDFEWMHVIDLILVPNPRLTPAHQAAVAAEHSMRDGRLNRICRLSLSFYFMTVHNLDVEPDVLEPAKQQLVLQNREEVVQARATARQLSKEALARAARSLTTD